MKPHGAIPHWWNEARIEQALAASGGITPCFVYDLGIVREKIAMLRRALPVGVGIHYAMKANPLPVFVAAVAALVDGIDIASGGELPVAHGLAKHISFAGPGKRDVELAAAIGAGVGSTRAGAATGAAPTAARAVGGPSAAAAGGRSS